MFSRRRARNKVARKEDLSRRPRALTRCVCQAKLDISTKLALHTHAGAGKSSLPEQLRIQRNISTNEIQMNDQHHQHMTKRSLDSAQSLQTQLRGKKNRVTTCYISPCTSFSSSSSAISRFFGFSNGRLFLWIAVEGEFKI